MIIKGVELVKLGAPKDARKKCIFCNGAITLTEDAWWQTGKHLRAHKRCAANLLFALEGDFSAASV